MHSQPSLHMLAVHLLARPGGNGGPVCSHPCNTWPSYMDLSHIWACTALELGLMITHQGARSTTLDQGVPAQLEAECTCRIACSLHEAAAVIPLGMQDLTGAAPPVPQTSDAPPTPAQPVGC